MTATTGNRISRGRGGRLISFRGLRVETYGIGFGLVTFGSLLQMLSIAVALPYTTLRQNHVATVTSASARTRVCLMEAVLCVAHPTTRRVMTPLNLGAVVV